MSHGIVQACRKRRRMGKVYDFQSFGNPGSSMAMRVSSGAFRDNIRMFVEEFADPEDYTADGMNIWCTLLVIQKNNFVAPLYTIQENINHSPQPFCNHCRCAGWSSHFVSKRKYHFIIPVDGEWNKPVKTNVFDIQTHLLHGLIHCNGFGHLLAVNGIEGGSKCLCGREIMDLWDRICTSLRARKITVEDLSKKQSMDLRLLYGVAYGCTWFSKWGYKFLRASFGVRENNYHRAIEILSSLELDDIVEDFGGAESCRDIKQIIHYYRDLSRTQLVTLRDLIGFMLAVKSCPCTQNKQTTTTPPSPISKPLIGVILQKKSQVKERFTKYRKFSSLVNDLDSRWNARRLEYAAEVIVDTLKEKQADDNYGVGGMSRQEVRDAARMRIGDTGLLDYVLKSMNNVIIGCHAVHRAVNPKTRVLEYSIQKLGDGDKPVRFSEPEAKVVVESLPEPTLVPGADVYSDLARLYMNVLLNYPNSEQMELGVPRKQLVDLATQVVLDSKHFVKEWTLKDEKDQILRFTCQVTPSLIDLEIKLTLGLPPGEVVILPFDATVFELKRAAENALRDTYCILENFLVTEIEHMEELDDRNLLLGNVESGDEIFLRGSGIDLRSPLRYEGGTDNWKVRCECGSEDDDGERMVACDICEVWQHTRCIGIEDFESVPPLFVCQGCCNSLEPSGNEPHLEFDNSCDFLMIPSTEYGAELVY